MNRPYLSFAGAMLAAGLYASTASAATITYSGAAQDMFWNGAESRFTWQQFDPLAGVLNAVTYKVAGAFDLTVSQTAPFAITPTYFVSKGFTLNGTGLVFKPSGSAPFDGVLNANWNGFGMLQPGATQTQTLALEFLRVPDFGLAPFTGSGSISTILGLSEDSDQCFSYDLSGTPYMLNCGQSGQLTVSVTYDYTPAGTATANSAPVPTPATAWLLALGVLAMSTLRRTPCAKAAARV